jgi:hypothetical protein
LKNFWSGVSSKVRPQVAQIFCRRLLGSLTSRFWIFTVPAGCAANNPLEVGGGRVGSGNLGLIGFLDSD